MKSPLVGGETSIKTHSNPMKSPFNQPNHSGYTPNEREPPPIGLLHLAAIATRGDVATRPRLRHLGATAVGRAEG